MTTFSTSSDSGFKYQEVRLWYFEGIESSLQAVSASALIQFWEDVTVHGTSENIFTNGYYLNMLLKYIFMYCFAQHVKLNILKLNSWNSTI